MTGDLAPAKRPRSKNRQRVKLVAVHCTPDEFAKIDADAHALGLSMGGYLRALALGAPTPDTRRRPLPSAPELARLLGQFGKIGSNLNQLTHAVNAGLYPPVPGLADAVAELRQLTFQTAERLHSDC